jgi:polar amino acid transport system substrate-binding protein
MMTRSRPLRWRPVLAIAGIGLFAMLAACTPSAPTATAAQQQAPMVLPAGAVPSTAVPTPWPKPCTNALGAHLSGNLLETIRKRGYLKAGVDQNTYLWGYLDRTTNPASFQGFDIDMIYLVDKAIFPTHTPKVHFVVVPNASRQEAVTYTDKPESDPSKVDIVAETMTINCERLAQVSFSSVYYLAHQKILVSNGSPIKTVKDLAGKTVCAPAKSTSLKRLDQLSTELPSPIHTWAAVNETDCLVMLQQGQVDAFSTDDTILAGMAVQDPNLEMLKPALENEPYGLAISKDETRFTAFVDKVIATAERDHMWATDFEMSVKRFATKFPTPQLPSPIFSYQPTS